MKKKMINEIKRFQRLAGVINEMHVDASGNLISDEEFVRQIVWKHSTSLAKALSALHKGLGDERKRKRAKDFIKQWLINVAEEIGLDPVPSFDDPMFYQGRDPGEILNYVRDTLTSMLEQQRSDDDEGELTEDDYTVPDNARSGDTAIMGNIAEDGLDLSDTPKFKTQYPRDFHKDPDFRHWIFDKSSGWECNQVLRLFHLMRRKLKEEKFVDLFIFLQSPESLKYWWDYYTQDTDQSDEEFYDFEDDLMPVSENELDLSDTPEFSSHNFKVGQTIRLTGGEVGKILDIKKDFKDALKDKKYPEAVRDLKWAKGQGFIEDSEVDEFWYLIELRYNPLENSSVDDIEIRYFPQVDIYEVLR